MPLIYLDKDGSLRVKPDIESPALQHKMGKQSYAPDPKPVKSAKKKGGKK